MATFRNPSFARMVQNTLKKTSAALRDADIPFLLVGSLSAWVRGGPESSHDLDFGIRECDVLRAAEVLEAIGMTIEVPTEDWLIKAWDGEPEGRNSTLVDLIYAPSGMRITDEVIARADEMDVLAQRMRILSASDLMVQKTLALREQNLNLTSTIATARAIREQVDWDDVRERTMASPYALGFFAMAEALGIVPPAGQGALANSWLIDMQAVARPTGVVYQQRRELLNRLHRQPQPAHSSLDPEQD